MAYLVAYRSARCHTLNHTTIDVICTSTIENSPIHTLSNSTILLYQATRERGPTKISTMRPTIITRKVPSSPLTQTITEPFSTLSILRTLVAFALKLQFRTSLRPICTQVQNGFVLRLSATGNDAIDRFTLLLKWIDAGILLG